MIVQYIFIYWKFRWY